MKKEDILKVLQQVFEGKRRPQDAIDDLQHLPFEDLEFAKLDMHRPLRNGFSEVIYCAGKTIEQIATITQKFLDKDSNVLGTRISKEAAERVVSEFPSANYDELSNSFQIIKKPIKPIKGKLGIVAAGTADINIAEEAKRTAQFFGAETKTFYDVGVAGLHRLVAHLKELQDCDVLIAIAGMEGALPSVIGGLIAKPIIAVPTSVGYGAHFGGITPLLAMLNSCSEGITVVNIDNGFGAACAALRILNQLHY